MIPEPPSLSRASLMSITLVLEGVLLLIATVWSWSVDLALLPQLKFTGFACLVGILAAPGLSVRRVTPVPARAEQTELATHRQSNQA